jgi:hypothetical protein
VSQSSCKNSINSILEQPIQNGDLSGARIKFGNFNDVHSIVQFIDPYCGFQYSFKMNEPDQSETIGEKLAPFNPAGFEVVDIALSLLNIGENDTIYDLGCGDARLLVKVV